MLRRFMNAWVFVLPFPVLFFVLWYWILLTKNSWFVAHVFLLALIYGYVAPGIATNFLKLWRFTGKRWKLGQYYWHHGFLYARHMTLFLAIPFMGIQPAEMSLERAVSIILSSGFIHGFFYWWHDTVILKLGILELNTPAAKKAASPEAAVYGYAPVVFTLLGMSYALSAVLAYRAFVIEGQAGVGPLVIHLSLGLALVFVIPSIAFRWLQNR